MCEPQCLHDIYLLLYTFYCLLPLKSAFTALHEFILRGCIFAIYMHVYLERERDLTHYYYDEYYSGYAILHTC